MDRLLAMVFFAGVALAQQLQFPREDWNENAPDPLASPWAVKGGTIRFTAFQPPKSLNYYVDSSVYTAYLFDMMYETLLSMNSVTSEFQPSLACSWRISEDGREFTFILDPAAKWSDGKPVLAEDVQWTWDAVMDPKNATGPFKVSLGTFERPEVLSERIVKFKAKENHWRNLLSCGSFEIMPKHVYEGKNFNQLDLSSPVVSGPYVVAGVKEQIETRMRRRQDWWAAEKACNRNTMNFDEIVFRYFSDQNNAFEAFKKGLTDIYPVYSARMWAAETRGDKFDRNWIVKQKIRNFQPVGFQGFAMNMRRFPFDDLRVRKAFAHLVDRETMNRTMMFGAYFLQRSYFEDLYGAEHECRNPFFEYNPAKAEALLAEAGFKKNPQTGLLEKEGKPLAFTFLTRDSGSDKFLALCDNVYKKLGIQMKIERKDWAAWMRDMDDYNFDMTWAAWGGTIMRDPESMWLSAEADRPSGNNITGFKDKRVDELIERQKTLQSISERNELLRELDFIVSSQVPYVLLWNINSVRLLYWDKFGTPPSVLSRYGNELSALSYWWYDEDAASELAKAIRRGGILPRHSAEISHERPPAHVSR